MSGRGAAPMVVDLHVWGLDVSEAQRQQLTGYLSADEAARAASFVYARDREHFVVARGRLREMLSRYVAVPAAALQFNYSEHGKPRLCGPGPNFNLSHCDDVAVLAVCWDCEIGVDIEAVRPVEPELAQRIFSDAEMVEFASLAPADRLQALFRGWTRKEALLKAAGLGLGHVPLPSVALAANAPPRVLQFQGDPQAEVRWTLLEAAPVPGTIVSLAACTDGRQLLLRYGVVSRPRRAVAFAERVG